MLSYTQDIPKITTLDFILLISLYSYPSTVLPKPSPGFFLRVSQTNIIFTHTHLHSSTFFEGGACESRNPTDLDGYQGHRDE